MHKLIAITAVLIGMIIWVAKTSPRDLVASWYDIPGGTMANGQTFDSTKFTCATRDWPLGTRLTIFSGRDVVHVTVTDRINKRFTGKRIDLTPAAFQELAPLEEGIVDVKVARR